VGVISTPLSECGEEVFVVRELEFNGSTCKMGSSLRNTACLVLTLGQQRPWQVHTEGVASKPSIRRRR
jgi:hypothetical protein